MVAEVEVRRRTQDGVDLVCVGSPARVGVGGGAGVVAGAGDHRLPAFERPASGRCDRGDPGEEPLERGLFADPIQRQTTLAAVRLQPRLQRGTQRCWLRVPAGHVKPPRGDDG